MYVVEESDWAAVPAKGPNKGGPPPAEDLEGRVRTKENAVESHTVRTPRRNNRVKGSGGRAERALL